MRKKARYGKEKSHLSSGQSSSALKCYYYGKKIHELRHELLPYLPDLAPSDFDLFSKLKVLLGGPRFSTTEELISEVETYFTGLEESHF